MSRRKPNDGEWEARFKKLYGKEPTSNELIQFQSNFPKEPSFGEKETNDDERPRSGTKRRTD